MKPTLQLQVSVLSGEVDLWSYLFELLDLGLIEHGKDVRSGPLATLLWMLLSRCSRSALSEKKQVVNDKESAVLPLIGKLAETHHFLFFALESSRTDNCAVKSTLATPSAQHIFHTFLRPHGLVYSIFLLRIPVTM